MMSASFAIVIASKNRPADVERAVRSVRAQPTQPDQLIVVDQSERPYVFPRNAYVLHHYDPGIPSLTVARNAGIALNVCEIVLFIDDDVEFTSDVVGKVRAAMQERPDAVGLQAEVLFPEQRTQIEPPRLGARLWDLWKRVFWRGFLAWDVPPKPGTGELQSLHGCAMAFRSSLFERELFDEALRDYSFGEDWEFCKRARRHGRLYVVPGATVVHHESPANRYRQRRLLEQRWRNVRYFYDKLPDERGPADALWLRWWMLGEAIVWLRKGYGLPRTGARS
jgi:GT2 family glycosyltransferase